MELDGVGPVYNKPSNNWLHNIVQKSKKNTWVVVGVEHTLNITPL